MVTPHLAFPEEGPDCFCLQLLFEVGFLIKKNERKMQRGFSRMKKG